MSVEQQIEKLNDKFNDIDKSVAVLVEKTNNYLDKIDENDSEQKKEIEDIKESLTKIKADISDLKQEQIQNSKQRKIINSVVWLTFTSVVGLVFFYIKEKIKGN